MCIIVVKKKEQKFDPSYVERMYDMGNKDGFGMMWNEVVNGVVRVRTDKSMASWKVLEELYAQKMDNDIAIHVRNATYGEKNLDNCHPYCVLDMDLGHKMDLYMMHNGTIKDVQVDKKMSDSYNFATKFLRGYLEKHLNALQDPAFQFLLAGIIGANKLVFLDSKKRWTIVNGDLGAYHQTGVWVSTRNDIKIYDYRKQTEVAESFDVESNNLLENGEWEKDRDNRLHFRKNVPPPPPPQNVKIKSEEAIATTDEELEQDGTDSGTALLVGELDEEGLNLLASKLPNMPEHDVFSFVIEYHHEALELMKKLSDPIEFDVVRGRLMIGANPWDATRLLIKIAKDKIGTQVATLN